MEFFQVILVLSLFFTLARALGPWETAVAPGTTRLQTAGDSPLKTLLSFTPIVGAFIPVNRQHEEADKSDEKADTVYITDKIRILKGSYEISAGSTVIGTIFLIPEHNEDVIQNVKTSLERLRKFGGANVMVQENTPKSDEGYGVVVVSRMLNVIHDIQLRDIYGIIFYIAKQLDALKMYFSFERHHILIGDLGPKEQQSKQLSNFFVLLNVPAFFGGTPTTAKKCLKSFESVMNELYTSAKPEIFNTNRERRTATAVENCLKSMKNAIEEQPDHGVSDDIYSDIMKMAIPNYSEILETVEDPCLIDLCSPVCIRKETLLVGEYKLPKDQDLLYYRELNVIIYEASITNSSKYTLQATIVVIPAFKKSFYEYLAKIYTQMFSEDSKFQLQRFEDHNKGNYNILVLTNVVLIKATINDKHPDTIIEMFIYLIAQLSLILNQGRCFLVLNLEHIFQRKQLYNTKKMEPLSDEEKFILKASEEVEKASQTTNFPIEKSLFLNAAAATSPVSAKSATKNLTQLENIILESFSSENLKKYEPTVTGLKNKALTDLPVWAGN